MITAVQVVVAAGACWGLFWLFRRSDANWPVARAIIAAGFLTRALLGQFLFWVSYLRLPIATHLQLGDGYWFFGLDGQGFFNLASAELAKGPMAVLWIDKTWPAAVFVQVLAVFIALFGAVASVGLLLNLFCYLGMSAAIARWGNRTSAGIIALIAVSFTPSWLLWAVQPMKDPLFLLAVVLFLYGLARVQATWLAQPFRVSLSSLGVTVALLIIPLYVLAGIRWYFALALLAGAALFAIALVMTTRAFRLTVAAVSILILIVLSQVLVWGAGPYLPSTFKRVLAPASAVKEPEAKGVVATLDESRRTQEVVQGATTLQAGRAIDIAAGPTVPPLRGDEQRAEPPPRRKVIIKSESQRPIQPLTSPRVEVAETKTEASEPSAIRVRLERLIVGMTAMVIPRTIASKLGLLELHGGRGLWLFAEVDTLVFDAFLIIALGSLIYARRSGVLYKPILWPVLSVTLVIALAVSYVSTNFGTMFRHREMVLIGLCLLPLALRTGDILAWDRR